MYADRFDDIRAHLNAKWDEAELRHQDPGNDALNRSVPQEKWEREAVHMEEEPTADYDLEGRVW
jgi:hypothetical protein